MRICVLGSEGQIGAHVTSWGDSEGFFVSRVDKLITTDHDLTQSSRNWTSAIADCDVVVFLAFDVGGANYLREFQNTHAFLHSNTIMMLNVFETVKQYNKKIIFASSVTAFDLDNSYGNCKLLGERLCASIGGISVRLWNIYGFETDPSRYHVVMDFISQARTEGKISCKTTGHERRQFLYGEDCASAIFSIINRYNEIIERTIHISSGKWTSIHDVAHLVADVCNVGAPIFSDRVETLQQNEYSPYISPPDWVAMTDLRSGIKKIVDIYDDETKK